MAFTVLTTIATGRLLSTIGETCTTPDDECRYRYAYHETEDQDQIDVVQNLVPKASRTPGKIF